MSDKTEKADLSDIITDEMLDWFDKRTKRHIELVQKYAAKIAEADDRFSELPAITEHHDQSKYESPERDPYVLISWDYHCKDTGKKFKCPSNIKELMNDATEHHVHSNAHHPESHAGGECSTINREDRDAVPDKIIDATSMSDIAIGEMVADWLAMSEEKSTDPVEWCDKNIGKRWKFTDDQEKLIRELIDKVWKPMNTKDEAQGKGVVDEAKVKSAYKIMVLEAMAEKGLTPSDLGRMAKQAGMTKQAWLGGVIGGLGRFAGGAAEALANIGGKILTVVLPVAGGGAGLASGYLAEQLVGPTEADVAREITRHQIQELRAATLRQQAINEAKREEDEEKGKSKRRAYPLQISSAI